MLKLLLLLFLPILIILFLITWGIVGFVLQTFWNVFSKILHPLRKREKEDDFVKWNKSPYSAYSSPQKRQKYFSSSDGKYVDYEEIKD